MEIEDKYLSLINQLVYDKRTKKNGILSELAIMQLITGYYIYYNAFMGKTDSHFSVYVDDFEKGNVVFLRPFGYKYMEKEIEEMADQQEQAIKDFFGDKFREDMIMRVLEDERKEWIRKREKLTLGLDNWDDLMETIRRKKEEAQPGENKERKVEKLQKEG